MAVRWNGKKTQTSEVSFLISVAVII